MSRTMIRKAKNKDNPYVMLHKGFLSDTALSWKAKGLLSYLLSLPDDWKIYMDEIKNHSKDGRESTASAFKELINAGYIIRKKIREYGKFKGYEYLVFEMPESNEFYGEPETPTEKPDITVNGKTVYGKPVNGKTVNGKPATTNNNNTNNNTTNKKQQQQATEDNQIENNINSAKDTEKPVENENNCSDEEINAIKDKADVKLGTKINKNTLLSLVREHGKEKVEYYLNNWGKFESIKKHNTVGFFVKCVSGGWEFPKNGGGIQEKPIQATNYYQREYTEEDFESMYDNLV